MIPQEGQMSMECLFAGDQARRTASITVILQKEIARNEEFLYSMNYYSKMFSDIKTLWAKPAGMQNRDSKTVSPEPFYCGVH